MIFVNIFDWRPQVLAFVFTPFIRQVRRGLVRFRWIFLLHAAWLPDHAAQRLRHPERLVKEMPVQINRPLEAGRLSFFED
jgi:hypothetical protein